VVRPRGTYCTICDPGNSYVFQAVTTKDGKLVITMSEVNNHDLNFQSGTSMSHSLPRNLMATKA
jgi:beta-glucanase (GH16 family)